MELRHLRYFLVLADELHFGRAAQRLFITQPPLSFGIRQLETHLGGRLFLRDSKRVELTALGAAFLPEAIRTVAQANSAEELGRAFAAGKQGSLQIGFTSSMLYRGMPEILQAHAARYPAVDVRLADMTVVEQAQALHQRRIHGSFSSGQTIASGLTGQPLAADSFVCCVPQQHWAAKKRRVRLDALAQEDFIMFTREITPAGYDHVLTMCIRAGFHPRERAHVRQWLTAAALVSKGFGIAIVPASLEQAAVPGVKFVPIENAQTQTSGFFVWNPEALSPPLENLIAEVVAYTAKAVKAAPRRTRARPA